MTISEKMEYIENNYHILTREEEKALGVTRRTIKMDRPISPQRILDILARYDSFPS